MNSVLGSFLMVAVLLLAGCTATLLIDSLPGQANVYIDEDFKGQTPLRARVNCLEDHSIHLKMDGYEDVVQIIDDIDLPWLETRHLLYQLRAASPDKTAVRPEPSREYALVRISSVPAAAEVYLDGEFVGSTPLEGYRLAPGTHQIVVKKHGYSEWSREAHIVAGNDVSVVAELRSE